MGRVYDAEILDMFEISLTKFEGEVEKVLSEIDEAQKIVFMAIGDAFEYNTDLLRIRNLLHDMMTNRHKDTIINLETSVKYTFLVQALDETTLRFGLYRYNKNSDKIEKMPLEFEGKVGRRKLADNDRFKKALEKMKKIKSKAKKNVEEDDIGDKVGRIHVQQDNLKTLRIKKLKNRAVKNSKKNTRIAENKKKSEKKNGKATAEEEQ